MPKVGMEPIRRRQMIDATMTSILEDGIGKASMQRIARRAGLTSGLIVHYFDDKDGLLEAVYRDLFRRLGADTLQRLRKAEIPAERLLALLEAQVSDEMLRPEVVATWCAIYAKIPEIPALARLERAYERRLTSNLVHVLRQLGHTREAATEISEELMSLIDGLWLNLANRISLEPEDARRILFRYLYHRVPSLKS